MDEFAKLIQEFGEPRHQVAVSAQDADLYRGRVPDALVDFWLEHGRGSYWNGKEWICDPEPFVPIVEAIFENDPELHPSDLVTIKRQAFANLMLWSRRLAGPVTVDLNTGNVAAFGSESWIDPQTKRRYPDDFIVSALFYRAKYVEAWVTEDDQDMLPLAIDKCGLLNHDEIYGFFPALQLGGVNEVDNLQRVKAVEHLLFLTHITEFQLARTVFPDPSDPGGYYRKVVRRIGAPS